MPSLRIRSQLNYLRMPPRKVRLVADAVRGKRVPEAYRVLRFLTRRAARPVAKLLDAAVANARQNFRISSADELVISSLRVDGGPTMKRSSPRAFGRASPIRKRTSHIVLELEATGVPPRHRRAAGPAVVALAPEAAEAEVPARTRPAEREAFRPRRPSARPADFVRRMFRRKAI